MQFFQKEMRNRCSCLRETCMSTNHILGTTSLTWNWYKEEFDKNHSIPSAKNPLFYTTQLNDTNDFMFMSLHKDRIKLVYNTIF